MDSQLQNWQQRVRQLKQEVLALYLAYRDSRTPWYAKAITLLVIAYALSPLDLIPDFIPVLGYLDDLILIPFGIILAIKLIPPEVLAEARESARTNSPDINTEGKIGLALVIGIWVVIMVVLVGWWVRLKRE